MNVTINGKKETLNANLSLRDLISSKGLDKEKIVIERNREIVSRDSLDSVRLCDNDSIEIVAFVGGG